MVERAATKDMDSSWAFLDPEDVPEMYDDDGEGKGSCSVSWCSCDEFDVFVR